MSVLTPLASEMPCEWWDYIVLWWDRDPHHILLPPVLGTDHTCLVSLSMVGSDPHPSCSQILFICPVLIEASWYHGCLMGSRSSHFPAADSNSSSSLTVLGGIMILTNRQEQTHSKVRSSSSSGNTFLTDDTPICITSEWYLSFDTGPSN